MTKTRGLVAYLISLAVFAGLNLAGAATHYSANRGEFEAQGVTYRALWGQSGIMYAYLFLPIVLAAWVAMASKVEHDDRNLQRMAGYDALIRHVLPGKLLGIGAMAITGSLIYWTMMLLTGVALGFGLNGELGTTLVAALLGAIGSASVMTVLLYVGLRSRGFALPVALGFVGSVFGLALTLLLPPLAALWPFCLPGNLMFVRSAGEITWGSAIGNVVVALLWMGIAIGALRAHLKRREF